MNDNKVTPDLEKPDFEKMAFECFGITNGADEATPHQPIALQHACKFGMEKIWNEYVPKKGFYIAQHEKIHALMTEIELLKREYARRPDDLTSKIEFIQQDLEKTRAAWKKDRDTLQVRRLEAERECLELKAKNQQLEAIVSKASDMVDVFSKTLRQLAADGTAIEGFTESWAVVYKHSENTKHTE